MMKHAHGKARQGSPKCLTMASTSGFKNEWRCALYRKERNSSRSKGHPFIQRVSVFTALRGATWGQ